VPIFLFHDPSLIAGHTERVTVEGSPKRYLAVSGLLSGKGVKREVDDVITMAGNGFPWQASIGAMPRGEMTYIDEGETIRVNGRVQAGPFYYVGEATLDEISIVPLGADTTTSTSVSAAIARGALLFTGA